MEITINSASLSAAELIRGLEELPLWPSPDIRLEIRRSDQIFRAMDPTVAAAVIAGAAAVLGQVVKCIGELAKAKRNTITIEVPGLRLTIPPDASPEKLSGVITALKDNVTSREQPLIPPIDRDVRQK